MWYDSSMNRSPDQYIAGLGFDYAYRVGGSVRDEVLGRPVKDYDYAVFGVDMLTLGKNLEVSGAKISKLQLRGNGPQIGWRAKVKGVGVLEIVLPRIERSTGSGRHDFEIAVVPFISIAEDAKRRDFTMNAIYYDVKSGSYIDPTDGLGAIEKGIVQTVHRMSFSEDPLRILRCLRFMSKLGFDITLGVANEMKANAECVTGLTQKGVSGTALTELEGILMGKKPGYALSVARDTGVLGTLLPELNEMLGFEQRSRYHEKNTDDHIFDAVQAAASMHEHAPIRVRMALLFHDAGKPKTAWVGHDGLQHYYALSPQQLAEEFPDATIDSLYSHEYWGAELAREALNRLNAPKQLTSDVVTLIERHMIPLWDNIRPIKVRTWRAELGDSLLRDLITHRLCDVLGKGGDVDEAVEVLEWIAAEQQRAIDKNVPVSVKDLKIDGRELHDLGLSGPDIGKTQRTLLHEVLSQPELNTNDWLAKRSASLAGSSLLEA